jgi:hypothetical protein
VGGADIGRSQTTPLRIEPEAGQVCKNGAECPQRTSLGSEVSQTPRAGFHVAVGFGREDSGDILDHHQGRSQGLDGLGDVEPQAASVSFAHPGTLAGKAEVLARKSGREDVDGLHGGPVDGGEVAEVGDAGPVPLEDAGGVLVPVGCAALAGLVLAEPSRSGVEHVLDGQIQTADAGAEGADRVLSHPRPPGRRRCG